MGEQIRVILWGREDVISQGVEIILRTNNDFMVSRVVEIDSADGLFHAVQTHSVDVVILNPGQQLFDPLLPLKLMKRFPGIKVITLDLECSSVEVYGQKKVMMRKVSDLIDLVGNALSPSCGDEASTRRHK